MSAATRSLVMAPQTGRPTEELTRAFPVLILVLTFIKDIRGLSFDVPPTLPVDGSKHWLVGGKINICTSPYTPMVSCALGEHLKPDKVGGVSPSPCIHTGAAVCPSKILGPIFRTPRPHTHPRHTPN
eukprot:jgi/Botrbrau1/7141/Bobra.0143s0018.1